MSKKNKNKEKFPHYWICDACAQERGGIWPEGHRGTFAEIKCKYCNGKKQKDTFIAPYVDYDWPDLDTQNLRD